MNLLIGSHVFPLLGCVSRQSQTCNVGQPDRVSSTLCVGCVPLRAVRGVVLTVDPTESGRAGAGVAVNAVCAVGSVPAGVALTLVDVLLALWTPEAR